jgi:hypothetical protein
VSNNGEYTHGVEPNKFSRRGWKDYLADTPFPWDEYDTWTQIEQRHYERGRLRAAGAGLVYETVPKREPRDIVEKTNGLRLVPPARKRRRRKPVRPLSPTGHDLR